MANNFENGRNNSLKNHEELIWYGIKKAQEIARREWLKIGQTVAHPDDKMSYALKEIKGEVAIVWLPEKTNTLKIFPLNELFDPNVAKREAVQKAVTQKLSQKQPKTNS